MPVAPPLSKVPEIPGVLLSKLYETINTKIEEASAEAATSITESVKIPENLSADDPRVVEAFKKIDIAKTKVNQLNSLINTVNNITKTLTAVIPIAQGIKVLQLINPVTAPAVIAAEITSVQNLTIANTITALKQLKQLPNILGISLDIVNKLIADALTTLAESGYNISQDSLNTPVEEDSIESLDTIKELSTLLQTQQNLLYESIKTAPSTVIRSNVPPESALGKVGDYYINQTTKIIYGPKPLENDWGEGIKY